jgi:hypothetical protein
MKGRCGYAAFACNERHLGLASCLRAARKYTLASLTPALSQGMASFMEMVRRGIPHPIGFAPLAALSPEGEGEGESVKRFE